MMALSKSLLATASRSRLRLLLAVVVSLGALAMSGSAVLAAEADDEVAFIERINDLRVREGLAPLQVDKELETAARIWANQISIDGALSHAPDLSVGVSSEWAKLGENVGVADADQLDELFDAFVNSPGHYANLTDPSFTHIGVGVVYDQQGQMWTTHRFMAKVETTTVTLAPTPTSEVTSTTLVATTSVPSSTSTVPSSQPTPTTTELKDPTTTAAPTTTELVRSESGRSPLQVVPTKPIDTKVLADLFASLSR